MLRRLCSIPLIALLLSGCGASDETRRADAEAIRAEVSRMPGVTSTEMVYTSSFGSGTVLRLDVAMRPDIAEADVLAVATRYQDSRARSSVSGFFSDLTLRIPRASGLLRLTVDGHGAATAETLNAEIGRLFALAAVEGAQVTIGVEPGRISSIDVWLTSGDLDIANAHRRVAALPGIEVPVANWQFSALASSARLQTVALESKGGYPGQALVATWDRQLAAVRTVLGVKVRVELTDFSDDLLLTTWLPTPSTSEADPERSSSWPAVTGQIQALHALGRPFTYRLEFPNGGAVMVDSDKCGPDDTAWHTAIRRYYRSLPGNRAPAC